MRIKARLGRDSLIALDEVKKTFSAEGNKKVPNGFVIEKAWHRISDRKEKIDWIKVGLSKIPIILNNTENISGVQTTFNIEDNILDDIKDFQYWLAQENRQIYYFPYIIKIILFANLLDFDGTLPMKL